MRKISILGTGYVGLVAGAGISEFGHHITCVDIDKEKINQLNNGKIPIFEPGLNSLIESNCKKERLFFSADIEKTIKESDIIFIAVGTPQNNNGDVDLNYVESVSKTISQNLNKYKIICTKSTVPVGTGKLIEKTLLKNNDRSDFDYVSNPEFLREGSAVKDFLIPDRLVIGARTEKAFLL